MHEVGLAVVGGVVAVIPVAVGAVWAWRSESRRRREERHLDLSREALTALQQLIRATIDVAYIDLPPRELHHVDTADQAIVRSAFEKAVTAWNSAMYAVLIGADPTVGQNVREIDQEVDRLVGQALSKRWYRIEFRTERLGIGELMAEHVALVRREAGLPPIELPTVWTWSAG